MNIAHEHEFSPCPHTPGTIANVGRTGDDDKPVTIFTRMECCPCKEYREVETSRRPPRRGPRFAPDAEGL